MAKIIIDNLKYKYPHTKELALDSISLEINEGEFIGIIGKNNSGKSTLCQAIAGLVPNFYKGAYGGRVLIDDLEVKKTPISTICKTAGLVFQNPFNQISGAKDTVYEEIAFGLENFGTPIEEMRNRIDEVLELLDIAEYKGRNPYDLSGGQMQRVAIASVMAMKPEILILDEPTSQLDPEGSKEVFEAVGKLCGQGITIIMVEHKMEKIAEYSDKILLLYEGKQIDYDKPDKIFSREDIEDYEIDVPSYTKLAKAYGKTMKNGLYPITLNEAKQCFMHII